MQENVKAFLLANLELLLLLLDHELLLNDLLILILHVLIFL